MTPATEPLTIIVTTRDRFSTTESCLDTLFRNTPEPFECHAVLGGAPQPLQKKWQDKFAGRVTFHFPDRLLNPSESRNVGLRVSKTRLTAFVDNDAFVRPGWLEPLIRCQQETGAAMVVPLILESAVKIHCAGNDLLITKRKNVRYGQKVLRFMKQIYWEGSNLKRSLTDYGELHCQLVETECALSLGAYDEKLREAGEVDSGLTWAKAGRSMWFEPASVVRFDFPDWITHAEDIAPFRFKWDMHAILEGYEHFYRKWDLDITECGSWPDYNVYLNDKLGFLTHLWPARTALAVDNTVRAIRSAVASVRSKVGLQVKARFFGRGRWDQSARKRQSQGPRTR